MPAMPKTPPEGLLVKIAGETPVHRAAGAIAGIVRQFGSARVRSVGAAATNQAVKAITHASTYLQEDGLPGLVMRPEFVNVDVGGRHVSGLLLVVWPCADQPVSGPPCVHPRGAPFEM